MLLPDNTDGGVWHRVRFEQHEKGFWYIVSDPDRFGYLYPQPISLWARETDYDEDDLATTDILLDAKRKLAALQKCQHNIQMLREYYMPVLENDSYICSLSASLEVEIARLQNIVEQQRCAPAIVRRITPDLAYVEAEVAQWSNEKLTGRNDGGDCGC